MTDVTETWCTAFQLLTSLFKWWPGGGRLTFYLRRRPSVINIFKHLFWSHWANQSPNFMVRGWGWGGGGQQFIKTRGGHMNKNLKNDPSHWELNLVNDYIVEWLQLNIGIQVSDTGTNGLLVSWTQKTIDTCTIKESPRSFLCPQLPRRWGGILVWASAFVHACVRYALYTVKNS